MDRPSRRTRATGALVALLGLLVGACSTAPPTSAPPATAARAAAPAEAPAATLPPAPLKMRVAHSAIAGSQALLNVAQEAGLFTRHGLEVELSNVAGRTATQALIAGELPLIVSSGAEVVASGLAGGDVVIVAAALNTLDTSLWSRELTDLSAIRGRRIGISQLGDSTEFSARYLARRQGLDPTADIEVFQVGQPGERLAALEAGAVDATFIQPPLNTRARQIGLRKLVEMVDTGLEYQHTVALSTRRRIADEPEPIDRFVRAWSEAIYYYRANPEPARGAVGRFMRLDDQEALLETYDHYVRLYARPPYPSLSALQTILDVLAVDDPRARSARPEQFAEPLFLDRLQAAGQFQAWEQQYPAAR